MSTHRLIEIRPIIKSLADKHELRSWELRKAPTKTDAKIELVVALREAGLSAVEVSDIANVDRSHVTKLAPHVEGIAGRAGSLCTSCNEVLPVAEFSMHPKTVDGLQNECRPCRNVRDHKRRGGKVRYRRRAGDRPRVPVFAWVASEIDDVLRDTAERNKVSLGAFTERALARALACTNCHRALREVGGDDCAACRKVWSMTG